MTSKEWKRCKIEELGKVITGKTPKTSIVENYGGVIPFLTPSDDMSVKKVIKTNKTLSPKGVSEVKNCLLPENTICISCIGSDLGKVVMTTQPTITNQQINSIIVNKNVCDSDFVYYSMLTLSETLKYHSKTSTAVPIINKTQFSNYEIMLPPLQTQQKIARVLSAIDDKIELNNSINSNLEQQAQAIFKSWFVDFEPFGGKMPNDWSLKTLSDVSNITAGGDKPDIVSNIETEECKIPIYSNGVDQNGLYGYTTLPKISQESVTVSARGTIGFTCLRLHPYVPIVRLISLIPITDIVSAKYLYFALLNKHITGTGTTQQQLTVPYFKTTEIIVPSFDIICNFTKITDLFYKIIEKNNMENSSLSQLRDTILPKLMSGEIDVDKVEV